MAYVHDPILLELVAIHSAVSIPHSLRIIRGRLALRLAERKSRFERSLEYLVASGMMCVSCSPAAYYGLSGVILVAGRWG